MGMCVTYTFLHFDVWTGDKLFHLLDHGFNSTLDFFQEIVCPLLSSFSGPVTKDFICGLNVHSNDLRVK